MLLTDHVQAIINSAKSIVSARNFKELEPEHIMLALMLDENELPKILLQRVGADNPKIAERLNNYLSKRAHITRPKFAEIRFSINMIHMMKIASDEARKYKDSQISIEHLFLALFKINNQTLNYLWEQSGINRLELYEKMSEEVSKFINIEETEGENSRTESNIVEDNVLEKYTKDLTEQAKKGKLDPVIGRDDEIRRTIQILNRRSKNNPVIIGRPGVGKTAIIEGLAQRIVCKDVPESLKNDKILALDMGAMLAGATYKGEFEKRLKSILKIIEENSDDLMLFIDEIHTIMADDTANLLKPMLARGNVRVIGATTIEEYRKYIEKDKALERRFQPVTADEPSVETSISILRGLKEKYEAFHQVKISDAAITTAVKLSHRYIQDRCLPDKAIDLLDEAASALRIGIETVPEEIDIFVRQKLQLEMNKKALTKDLTGENNKKLDNINKKISNLDTKIKNLREQWLQEKKMIDAVASVKKNIENIKQKIELDKNNPVKNSSLEAQYSKLLELEENLKTLNKTQKKRLLKEEVDEDAIASIVAKWTGIPVKSLMDDEAKRLLDMENIIHTRIIGQDEAVQKISNAIRLSRSGLHDPKRPIGTFLFLGPSGTGKTELVKTLAGILFNDENALIRIDMSEFMEKASISRLTGTTAGYVGYEEGGQLTEAVRRKPYSVILFDEIEKAHSDVFNLLLQVFDEGRLTDGQGNLIDFKNTVLIMTSNLAGDFILDEKLKPEEKISAINQCLKQKFKPEFLNRIDEIITFNALTQEELGKVFDIQINILKSRLCDMNIDIHITNSAKKYIVNESYDPIYGARPLKRTIRQMIEIPLSTMILEGKTKKFDNICIDFKNNQLVFSVV